MSLATEYPDIAAEWHPFLNGTRTPDQVASHSHAKAFWWIKHNDLESGTEFEFVWEACIGNRVNGRGCPYLSGKAVWKGYNDLQTCCPELSKEWHPIKNGDLTPDRVYYKTSKKVWWQIEYWSENNQKWFTMEWEAAVNKRSIDKQGCPFLTGHRVLVGFNDLQSQYPEIAAQWHYEKNNGLTPEMVTAFSNVLVWWRFPYDDPISGRHFDFEWQAHINGRVRNDSGCPYLTDNAVWPGFNDLLSHYPNIALQWNYEKNGQLRPEEVHYSSTKKVWWMYPYDDPVTGKHFIFEWQSSVCNRTTKGSGCPQLSGKIVEAGFNDLLSQFPEVAAEWHPTKNGELRPDNVSCFTSLPVWWYMEYEEPDTGKHFAFEWKTAICNRTFGGTGCPFLCGVAVFPGFNDLASKDSELAADWAYEKNGRKRPESVHYNSTKKYWWRCPKCNKLWRARIDSRRNGSSCPRCG